jgi:hypothetical protein
VPERAWASILFSAGELARRDGGQVLLKLTRVWLPIAISLAGIAAIVLSHAHTALAGAGVVLLGTALIVLMVNWLFRMSVESNRDREQEEEAREHFDRHGRWPDEGDA